MSSKTYKACILVVLYKKEIFDSKTINSLIKHCKFLHDCSVTIWNNGPSYLNKNYFIESNLHNLFDVEIVETIDNISLSKIYNDFIINRLGGKYIILDDDSDLSSEYIECSIHGKTCSLSVPIISCQNKITGPLINNHIATTPGEYSLGTSVIAIGSGMVLSHELVKHFIAKFGNVFDTRFRFYGVDVTFCYRFNLLKYNFNLSVISGFNHSLSKLEHEEKDVKEFRKKERSYDLGLRLKYYYPFYKAWAILLNSIYKFTLNRLFHTLAPTVNILDLFLAYFSGKHYKE